MSALITDVPCRIWNGPTSPTGLPVLAESNRSARRAAYATTHGDPGRHLITVTCGNPSCVEPAHLAPVLDVRTYCGNRHPWRPETTRWRKRRGGLERDCLLCRADQKTRARGRRRWM